MKFTKRLLTIALSMGMVMPLCATAYAAPTVTINSATIIANATDSNLYDVTVTFTVAESSKQLTLLLTGPNTDGKLDDNDIVHINQFGKDVSGEENYFKGRATCNFSVFKDRVEKAGATVDETTGAIDGLWLSMNTDDAVDEKVPSVQATYDDSTSTTVPVTGVTLDPTTLGLVVGGEGTLVATVEPDNATNKDVTWSSSNTDVATVDANGKVKAVAKGSATITAFVDANENGAFDDGEVKAECAVTVTEASSILYGDVNGDGNITPADRTVLARYLSSWKGYEIDKINAEAADVNDDGKLTPADRTVLARYLSNWTGYETLPKK